ncbi:MAG: alpha/beta hydrolase [Chloroflexi bacterium]|jgi:acetyl esterase/lipase|nr:alpha/beta hydrolase [Chloroflexota bacterium]
MMSRLYVRLGLIGVALIFGFVTIWWANHVNIQRDVLFGEADGQKLLLDVYHQNFSLDSPLFGVKPAIILLHGGGWASGSKHELQELGSDLAKQGYVAFSVEYRFATINANHYPAQLDDVQRAVRWVRANARRYSIDPNRISAAGISSGAHLAALLGVLDTRSNDDPVLANYSSRVHCVVSWYGIFDLTQIFPITPLNMEQQVSHFIGVSRSSGASYQVASPISYIDQQTARFLLIHGEKDAVVPITQTYQFANALQNAGHIPVLMFFANEGHGILQSENIRDIRQQFLIFLSKC